MPRYRSVLPVLTLSLTALLGACAGAPPVDTPRSGTTPTASTAPVTVDNCGVTVTVDAPPTRLVTLNQGATEVALSLGLQDRMVGTAYLDDEIASELRSAYEKVPVLAQQYPTKEAFLAARPDFAYAAYASAFEDKAVGTRADLAKSGIGTYLSPFGCPKGTPRADATFESAWREVEQVAALFGVDEAAAALVARQRTAVDQVRQAASGTGMKVFWYDSGDKTPFVGAGGGGPQLIIDAVGATNIFADLDGGWAEGSWERIVAAQPDIIVLADASWDTAEAKKKHLMSDPVLKQLKAVTAGAFVTIPFSESTPGVRLAAGATRVSAQLSALRQE